MKKLIELFIKAVKFLFRKNKKKEKYVSGKSDEIYPLF